MCRTSCKFPVISDKLVREQMCGMSTAYGALFVCNNSNLQPFTLEQSNSSTDFYFSNAIFLSIFFSKSIGAKEKKKNEKENCLILCFFFFFSFRNELLKLLFSPRPSPSAALEQDHPSTRFK
jgi:hypothetical protein